MASMYVCMNVAICKVVLKWKKRKNTSYHQSSFHQEYNILIILIYVIDNIPSPFLLLFLLSFTCGQRIRVSETTPTPGQHKGNDFGL